MRTYAGILAVRKVSPGTLFYMAGEIIQESREASGKQSRYASEGNKAHWDEVIDHYNHPRNAGSQSSESWRS
jgi:hypothetical protein